MTPGRPPQPIPLTDALGQCEVCGKKLWRRANHCPACRRGLFAAVIEQPPPQPQKGRKKPRQRLSLAYGHLD